MLYIELAIILALIVLNGVLAMAELAVVSSRRARLQALTNRDVIGSRRALALASDPGKNDIELEDKFENMGAQMVAKAPPRPRRAVPRGRWSSLRRAIDANRARADPTAHRT